MSSAANAKPECAWLTPLDVISPAQTINERRANVVQQARIVIRSIIGTNNYRVAAPKTPTIPFGDCDMGDSASRQIFTSLSRARSVNAALSRQLLSSQQNGASQL